MLLGFNVFLGVQGSVSYFKALAAKHRSATSSTLTRMSETLIKSEPSPTLQHHRHSKSRTGKHSLILSKETSPSICVKFDPDPELLEKIREDTRSTTPLSEIIKPYLHRGSIARHVSMRHSLIQPISAADKIEKPVGGPDISEVLSQKQDEVRRKDEEIADLHTHIQSLLAAPYLHLSGSTSPVLPDVPSDTSVTWLKFSITTGAVWFDRNHKKRT